MAAYKVAVLDDYQSFSKPYFDKLDATKYQITYHKDTLLSYNHPDAPKSELVARLEPFDVICTMRERTPFPRELIERLPNLKLLLTTGPRNLALDLNAFKERGIPVAGAMAYPKGPVDSTTEHIITVILAAMRNIAQDNLDICEGGWQSRVVTAISGKTIGLVGLGRLGANVAKIMQLAFQTKVIAWSSNLTQDAADEKARGAGLPVEDANGEKTFKVVGRDELFSTADVVSIHLVLSDRSKGLITSQDLSKMKPSSFFVNTSRGPLVVEKDLLDILEAGKIRGAVLDVFDIEPLPLDSPWRSKDWGKNGKSQLLVTPHTAYVEMDTLNVFYTEQVANLQRWAAGETMKWLL